MPSPGVTEYSYSWWINRLDKDEKRLRDGWWTKADKIVKRFKGKKDSETDDIFVINLFWSNVEVMKAALYGKKPKPVVKPIWQDPNDNIARVASLIMERCLGFDLMKNKSPMDAAVKLAVEDWLIPGLGMIWFRYESDIETTEVPGTPIKVDNVKDERICCDYVHWRDLIYPPSRTSEDVWYLGRRIYMSKEDIKKRFNIDVPDDGEKQPKDPDNVMPKDFTENKVCLYELWCKKNRTVYWVSREVPGFCQKQDDFLKLEGFYPAPMPLMATHTTDDYLPRADYTMMRDQYDMLNELNTRITLLEKALRVVGVYNKKNAEVSRILSESRENDMIAVDSWAALAEAGGLKGVVDWFPVDQVAEVLEKLTAQKLEKKQEIYELSGISDIMRGATNPRETLGAQKLKAQFGSVRLESRQDEIAQFVKAALSIKAEIICEHCQPQTIAAWSNIMSTDDAQYAEQAIALLKDEKLRQYRVDINEQILSLPDYQQEQENRMEFLTTVGQFLSQAAPMVEAVPGALPHLIQMIRWTASSFKGANEIQGVLDQALSAAQQPGGMGGKPGEQPEDVVGAENAKAQGAIQVKQLEGQQKKEQIQLEKDLELRNQMQVKGLEGNQKAQLEETKQRGEMVRTQVDNQHDSQESQQDRAQQQVATQQQMQHEDEMGEVQHGRALETAQQSHENSLEQGEQSGDVQLEVSKLRGAGGNRPAN